jgi:peptide/nickel transport system permease protein
LITVVGLNVGALIGGTVVIETLFAIPGLGKRLLDAVFQRDFLMIQGITVFVAVVYVTINTLVDIIYMLVDPRIRKKA